MFHYKGIFEKDICMMKKNSKREPTKPRKCDIIHSTNVLRVSVPRGECLKIYIERRKNESRTDYFIG